jgi:hypothetical protein
MKEFDELIKEQMNALNAQARAFEMVNKMFETLYEPKEKEETGLIWKPEMERELGVTHDTFMRVHYPKLEQFPSFFNRGGGKLKPRYGMLRKEFAKYLNGSD